MLFIRSSSFVYTTNAQVQLERQGTKSVSHAYSMDGSKRFIGYEGMHYNLMRDSSGNIASIRRALENYTLAYDQASRQSALTYPNRIESKSAFDPLGRLTTRTLGEQLFLSYQYDKTSRIVQKNNLPITYDSAYRILQVGSENYTYDDAGNLLGENTHIDPITQRLMRQGDTNYRYDIMGRLTQKSSPTAQTTYTYDSEGYLIEYVRKSVHGSTGSPRTNTSPVRTELVEVQLIFTYDPLGRRLTKHFKSLKVSLSNHETISEYHHRYLYDGADIVAAIYDNDGETVEKPFTLLFLSFHYQSLLPYEHFLSDNSQQSLLSA